MSRKNTEKHKIFSGPVEREIRNIENNSEENVRTISYEIKFIDGAKFMGTSLSNLIDNLAEQFHKIKYKYGLDNKKCRTCGFKYNNCECFLEYSNKKNDIIENKCLCCNKNYPKKFDETLKKLKKLT